MRPSLIVALTADPSEFSNFDSWDVVRAQFELSPKYLHFSSFFLASHPAPVRNAIRRFRRALDENPVLTVEHNLLSSEGSAVQAVIRGKIAEYLGGAPHEIALTPNTTTGLALVYMGLPLTSSDEILITTHDHFVHHEAVRLAANISGASVRKVSLFKDCSSATTDEIVERIRSEIRSSTRVLGLTWVHSSTGIRLPVRDISAVLAEVNQSRGALDRVLLVIDGVHGLGAVDETIAEMGADFFCAGTHKWIFAPRGTGIVWARADNWARLRPIIPNFAATALFSAWIEDRKPAGPATADWVTPGGFLAYEHQWAMATAFQMHAAVGRARVAARISELNGQLKDGLRKLRGVKLHTPVSSHLSAGICCFELMDKPAEVVVKSLLERGIIATASPYATSYPRLSAGIMNTSGEVDEVIAAMREIAN